VDLQVLVGADNSLVVGDTNIAEADILVEEGSLIAADSLVAKEDLLLVERPEARAVVEQQEIHLFVEEDNRLFAEEDIRLFAEVGIQLYAEGIPVDLD
jgi:hypothetical protein